MTQAGTVRTEVVVRILHGADCPQLDELERRLDGALARLGQSATIEVIEGAYPSPTLLVDGLDVTGRDAEPVASCRLDLPTENEILDALARATGRDRLAADPPKEVAVPTMIHDPRSPAPATEHCGPRALCGWSPAAPPADTNLKQRVDRLVLANRVMIAVVVAVVGLFNLAPHLPLRGGLAVDGLGALIAGAWCTLNFWRCRHAHCLVTGPGWLALGVFAFVESGLGRSVIHGEEQPVFLGVLGLALVFEAVWWLARRTNAVAPG